MQVYKGTFTTTTAVATQDITGIVDSLGAAFTPKAVIIWGTYQTAAGLTDTARFVFGFADNVITQRGYSALATDNVTPADVGRMGSTASAIVVGTAAAVATRTGTITAMASGQFTINWTVQDGVAAIFHFIAFNCDEVYVGRTNSDDPTTISPALSFLPDVVFTITGGLSNSATAWLTNFGWLARLSGVPNGQGLASALVENNVAAADDWRMQSATWFAGLQSSSSGVSLGVLASLNWGNTSSITSASVEVDMLCLKGVSAKAFALNQPVTTTTQNSGSLGFTPTLVMVMSTGIVATTATQTEARFLLGAGTSTTAQGLAWYGDLDAANPTVGARRHATTVIASHITPNATGSSSTILAEAALSAVGSDDFTLNWTTADTTARELLCLAIGDAAVAAGGGAHSAAFVG
jgi:hypothetical protein